MREWPPDSARGETAREARKMRVSMRVCHATTPERAECVDLRMRHVWSSVRSEHADHSLPDNHAERSCRTIVAASWLLPVPERGPPRPASAPTHIATDCRCRSAQTSHNVYQHKRFVTGTRSRSGGQYLRQKYEERAAATSDVPEGRRGGLHRPHGPRPPNGETSAQPSCTDHGI